MSHHHDHNDHNGHHSHNHVADRSPAGILAAFLLNLGFSVFELIGGIFTGSVAILSDALHDLGDAAGIGIAFFLEKKSRRPPDDTHTYGYARYSPLGGLLVTVILLAGSCLVGIGAFQRLLNPTEIDYDGMLLFAVVGVTVNIAAALLTRHGDSINKRAVNLHMLEDVLGWAVVLVGAVVMRFTDWVILDPLMSLGVAVFILFHALGNLREVSDLFLEKTPRGVDVADLRAHLAKIAGVAEIHSLRVRSLDGVRHEAVLHVAVNGDPSTVKKALRAELSAHSITDVTIEIDGSSPID
jgi:cobalt-zinc-cadmium efflux system protein